MLKGPLDRDPALRRVAVAIVCTPGVGVELKLMSLTTRSGSVWASAVRAVGEARRRVATEIASHDAFKRSGKAPIVLPLSIGPSIER
jgi:hypothetical protein